MAWIRSYGCVTAAGNTTADFWTALLTGRDCAADSTFKFQGPRPDTVQELLIDKLLMAFAPVQKDVERHGSFGVIFASTKGLSQDFVDQPGHPSALVDPLTPLLKEFLKRTELKPKRSLCISNACSSSLAAMALGQQWMEQGLDQVLIIAADAVTPFVLKGFQSLKLIEQNQPRPFSADRAGFFLGEAAACVLVTRDRGPAKLHLHQVGLDSEGSAVTRPSSSGASLQRAALRIPRLLELKPEILIAHGTGTIINDETEDLAFSTLFPSTPWMTGSKWCVGHTLAASGALDTIAACEALHSQKIFRLMTTETLDSRFKGNYLTRNSATPSSFSRILISSLGFGGMHASSLIERVQP